MSQWYLSIDGQRQGPFDDATARARAQQVPDGYGWKDGFDDWKRLRDIPELAGSTATPPPLRHAAGTNDEVDYRIVGTDMQFVEVELDPGESAIAEAGAMMYK
ncbi:MAG TPA: GYF domain-containing protein, partial [Rhodanobacteraceae bacterium]